jgi:hypothetical protein
MKQAYEFEEIFRSIISLRAIQDQDGNHVPSEITYSEYISAAICGRCGISVLNCIDHASNHYE